MPSAHKSRSGYIKLMKNISIIVAASLNNVIGVGNDLPWKLSADLKYFKNLTQGNTVIMGRKTYDSIGKPLPNRKNIIISRNKDLQIESAHVVISLQDALNLCSDNESIFIIGGATIYKQALLYANIIYFTLVHTEISGDTVTFPVIDGAYWDLISKENHKADEKNEYDYSFCVYKKK